MVKHGIKILHYLVLLITGVALVGVNVNQLKCAYSDSVHWEIQIMPEEDVCPCGEECGGEDKNGCCEDCCHDSTHDFYKVTDFSETEQGLQILVALIYLPESSLEVFVDLSLAKDKHFSPRHEIPDNPPALEFLCTLLC